MPLDLTRLAQIPPLGAGLHNGLNNGACIMEAVSYVAGEPWSDRPICVCPVIAAFLRIWNDALPDGQRDTLLRPLIPEIMDTRSTPEIKLDREILAADWFIREQLPVWLRLADLAKRADSIASLPEIVDFEQFSSLMSVLIGAYGDARDAENSSVTGPYRMGGVIRALKARNAAAETAVAAARFEYWDDPVWGFAFGIASAAAVVAARNKPADALQLTVDALQQSALALVRRMITA